MKSALRNLTLASAKHLVSQGHISGAHHKRIIKKVHQQRMPPPDEDPTAMGALSPVAPIMGGAGGAALAPEEGNL